MVSIVVLALREADYSGLEMKARRVNQAERP